MFMLQRRILTALFWLVPATLLFADALALESVTIREEAVRYQYGEGVDRDYARAYRLYCLAACWEMSRQPIIWDGFT